MITVEKQDAVQGTTKNPQEPILPRLHPTLSLWHGIKNGNLRDEAVLQSLAFYGAEGNWQAVWMIADALKREVSLLFDSQGLIWVDVGDRGMVHLSPPLGSRLPLRLWVHTHPWNAYWSATDRRTLGSVSGILERALVLGHDHLVRSCNIDSSPICTNDVRLATDGGLMHWSDENPIDYPKLRENSEWR